MNGHPIFPRGERVTVVERKDKPGALGVAMNGGLFVVPLPDGYDMRTRVLWVDGWIGVLHPDMPPMLADTTTGRLEPMNEQALGSFQRAYAAPNLQSVH